MAENEKKTPRQEHQSASDLREVDFAADKMGNNQLQGDDQANVRNQRHAQPGTKREADKNVRETLEKSDKRVRAERDQNATD
jgi:hypothetical protein